MAEKTRLEEIADDFIENYLRNNPVMIYSLDMVLEDYVQNIEGIDDDKRREYLRSIIRRA